MKASALIRGIVDLILTAVFALTVISGIALYLAPSGKVAQLTNWTFLGLNRTTWEAVHTYFGFVMVGLVALHLILGFNSMIVMLKSAFKKSKAKTILGLAVIALILVGGYFAFAKITAGEETSTEQTTEEIEITGSVIKEMTVQQIAEAYHVPVDKLISILETDYKIKAESHELLLDVAEKNGLTKSEFKDILAQAIQKAKGG